MARNKYPEETVKKILEVALQLFIEKGYDKTSIQDIVDHLGGLSKGAIYHHFKSKEQIFLAAYQEISESISREMNEVKNDPTLNGFEKLRKMFLNSFKNPHQTQMIASMPNLLDNPQFLAVHLNSTIHEVVPLYILPVINEGVADGSIHTDAPLELSNVLMLLSNIWINPLVYPPDNEDQEKKLRLFAQILADLGLPLLDEGLADLISAVTQCRKARDQ